MFYAYLHLVLFVSITTDYAQSQANEPPVWEETLEQVLNIQGVLENTQVGTVLGTLRARDPEGQAVTYGTERDVVTVDNVTGVVTLAEELDREVTPWESLWFTARDPEDNVISLEYLLRVLDVQDTPPVFENAPISLLVQENVPPNTLLETALQVRDGDTGTPRDVTVRISEDSRSLFKLDNPQREANLYTVGIRTRAEIDREEIGSQYTFKVRAIEMEGGAETNVSTEIVVSVNIGDENDERPTFNQDFYNVTVNENLERGAQIPGLGMIITDGDEGNNAYFELEVKDVDGNRFELSKSEIYTISPGSGSSSASITFMVNDNGFFDYEQAQYRRHEMEVIARETLTSQQRSSTATVVINIQDTNDNFPRFAESSYRDSVREDRDVGYPLTTITATDADSAPFSQLTYSLSGTGSDFFDVNSTSGEIRLARALDFEETQIFQLDYIADDNAGKDTTVRFIVTVLDFNDQGPVFRPDEYSALVGETTIALNPAITIYAEDADSDLPVTYRIAAGDDEELFNLDPNTGELTLTRPVNFKETPNQQGRFELVVEASDNGLPLPQTSTVIVFINVEDENDNKPVFESIIYYGQVREISPPGSSVVTVQASDFDSGLNAHIDYVIQRGSVDNFVIDHETGEVTVAPNANLDIETNGDRYEMIVHAIDRGSPQQTGTATVIVTVTDSNNKVPRFGQDVYILSVREDTPEQTVIETLSALDPDDTASLRYRIEEGSVMARDPFDKQIDDNSTFDYVNAFRVDPVSGEILTNLPLDHDVVRVVEFQLLAQDMNAEIPDPQIGRASVAINILDTGGTDVSFQPPWNDPEYVIRIPEEQPVTSVITQIVATDPVTGTTITDYREVAGSDPRNFFSVDGETGQITINSRLDYEELLGEELSFQVRAFTAGPDVRTAAATLRVILEDINDNVPAFSEPRYDFSLSEEERPSTVVGQMTASDPDSANFSSIVYSISGPGSDMFYVDPDDGVLYVAPNVTLDHETTPVYHLFVTATDNPGGEDSTQTTVPLTITLDDENDNAPVFTRDEYEIQTPDKRDRNKILGFVTARDADSDKNGKVTYTMIAGDTDLFRVESNGTIRSNKSLEGEARIEPYRVVIRASDSGVNQLHSDVTVYIYIQDSKTVSGPPVFGFPSQDDAPINMTEEVEPGTNVTQIEASSNDPSARITYSFVVNEALQDAANKFHIDPETGVITVQERLDRETQSRYELIIMVRDDKQPPGETVRRVFIDLTDINDNPPSFDCPGSPIVDPLGASVLENLNQTEVVRLVACDADDPDSSIYFSIDAGNGPLIDDVEPFRIVGNGTIFTNAPLDRETKPQYTLTVSISNELGDGDALTNDTSPEDGARRRRDVTRRTDVITVVVTVEDVDDNGPEFNGEDGSSPSEIVEGVVMTARPGTEITQLRAADADSYGSNTYALEDEVYFDANNKVRRTAYAFTIDSYSGVVETNLEEYVEFVDGYFRMNAVAMDGQGRRATSRLFIYVVRESQRLRFVFDDPPDDVAQQIDPFLRSVTPLFPEMDINTDALHYHARKSGKIDFGKSDLCFHAVQGRRVLNADVALDRFERTEEDSSELRELYGVYGVLRVDVCEVKVTTRWWSGYWWLWWWLIALALFILLVALICICIICICWPKYLKHAERDKPYRVYEASTILPPASDYEWQEEVVKMQ